MSLDGLEDTESTLLHGSDGVILLLNKFLVASLQLLDLRLEGALGVLDFLVGLGDLSLDVGVGHSHSGLDLLLLGIVAQVKVGRATARSEVLLGKLPEVIEVAADLVVSRLLTSPCLMVG